MRNQGPSAGHPPCTKRAAWPPVSACGTRSRWPGAWPP